MRFPKPAAYIFALILAFTFLAGEQAVHPNIAAADGVGGSTLPRLNATLNTARPTFQWPQAALGDNTIHYKLTIISDNNLLIEPDSSLQLEIITQVPWHHLQQSLPNGSYSWRVDLQGEGGRSAEWVSPRSFQVDVGLAIEPSHVLFLPFIQRS